MSLNNTPRSSRVHIALFGNRNAGKSSIINALTNQQTAIVSDIKGTTTDPVYKSMEILPIGPCVIIDTAGLDDDSQLGTQRVNKSLEVLDKTDVAIYVIDSTNGIADGDRQVIKAIQEKTLPLIIVFNKSDIKGINKDEQVKLQKELDCSIVSCSASDKKGIDQLKQAIIKSLPDEGDGFKIIGDLIKPKDFVVLVTPIDNAAPKGRLILPQQQTVRDILDSDAIAIVTKENELKETLNNLGKKPALVVTDSQAFKKVAADTPKDIWLTSFSILFARQKGDLNELIKGAMAINSLKDGDRILISEGCTHHRQSDDIGSVKIPRWLREATGKDLDFHFTSGNSFSKEVKDYALIVHCGGCMLNRKGMMWRIDYAKDLSVPIVNYGVLIAYLHGILERALEPFPLAKRIWLDQNLDK